jgi:UDP-N-acetylglucosamine acyltransferase
MGIHPTAIIEDGAELHPSVSVGPYSIIESGAVIGEGCRIESCVRIFGATRMGAHNRICHGATLGSEPQDLGFKPELARPLVIGDHNIFANTATLAGHCEVADRTFLSGQVAVHQFCRIGAYAMVAGVTGVAQDVPPFALVDGHRARIVGLNVVGLRRGGFSQEQRARIKAVYRLVFRSGLRSGEVLVRAEQEYPGPETQAIVQFIQSSRRGVVSFQA